MAEKDIQGWVLFDFFLGKEDINLKLHTSYGKPEEMPVEVFFRDKNDFTKLERTALENCRGKVLDVGAAGGSFTLELQEKGLEVVALEISRLSCQIMSSRGVDNVVCENFWSYKEGGYDTILLMMNGIGLAGKLSRVPDLLNHFKQLLAPGGSILVDSSDISYLYKKKGKPTDHYFGEVSFSYEYEGNLGEWFDWVYVDEKTLIDIVKKNGLKPEVLYKDKTDQFLLKLSIDDEHKAT